jgi:hypothetical protein
VAPEARVGRGEDVAVVEDDPCDRRVLQLVAADANERVAPRRPVENADAEVRVGVRVRLAGPDPEAVVGVDAERADRERRCVVRQRRPGAVDALPPAAVGRARVERRAVDGERAADGN